MGKDSSTPAPAFQVCVLTLFPELFPGPLQASLTGRALEKKIWSCKAVDLRSFAPPEAKGRVDKAPAGGGPGMLLQAEPVHQAILATDDQPGPLFYLSPKGAPFTQSMAQELARGPGVRLLCGRYEGVDQRVLDKHMVAEISIGDYVLSGGEIAALAVLDSVLRLLPCVVGNAASLEEETFGEYMEAPLLEYPQYAEPSEWRGLATPEVLLSGHHARIRAWRKQQAESLTRQKRPDLWQKGQSEDISRKKGK